MCLTRHKNAGATIDAIPWCGRAEPRLSRMPVERHRANPRAGHSGRHACMQPHLLPACMLVCLPLLHVRACVLLLAVARHWLAEPLRRLTVPQRWFAGSTQSRTTVPRDRVGSAPSSVPHHRSARSSRSRIHHSAAPLGLSVPCSHAALSFRSRDPSARERYISANPSRPCI